MLKNRQTNKFKKNFQFKGQEFWEKFFLQERSKLERFLKSLFIAAIGFAVVSIVYEVAGAYYPSISIVISVLIALFGGLVPGLILIIIFSLLADYFYIPPPGLLFYSRFSSETFFLTIGLGITMSFLGATMRGLFRSAVLAKQEANRAVQSRDEMIGIISHELKNPLTVLQLGTKLLQKDLSGIPGTEDAQQQVEKLMSPIFKMNRLISDLLDVSRLESKAFILNLSRCNFFLITQDVIKTNEISAQQKSIHLKNEVDSNCPEVFCDCDRVNQILTNLINNSIKFTHTGGEVRVSARQIKDLIEVKVTDTGIGIPEKSLPHVFDRFWQLKSVPDIGTGLGLTIVKGLVEAHGGKIWVRSHVGFETSFYFTLPIAGVQRMSSNSSEKGNRLSS